MTFTRHTHISWLLFMLLILAACQNEADTPAPRMEITNTPASMSQPTERILSLVDPNATLIPPSTRTLAPFTPVPTSTVTLIVSPSPIPTETPLPTPIAAIIGVLNDPTAPQIPLSSAPAFNVAIVTYLSGGTFAQLIGRSSDSLWYAVTTIEGQSGWVYHADVYALEDLSTLRIIEPQPYTTLIPPTATPTPIATITPTPITLGDTPAMLNRLRSIPTFYNFNTQSVQAIYQHGRQLGNRADVFTVIGDSNSTNGDYLVPIGVNARNYCEFDRYSYLIDTVNFFSTSMDTAGHNSFTHDSVTAQRGFNSAAVFDPIWSSSLCMSNETPLACEYRTSRASIAVIMLGGIDITSMTTTNYDQNMRRIVEASMNSGVIPILTTFIVLPERDVWAKSLEFNMMLIDIADAYQIPLINLWAAAEPLPDHGISPDRTHLRAQVGRYCDFNGAETQLGGTLRNLLTLQAFDILRRDIYSLP